MPEMGKSMRGGLGGNSESSVGHVSLRCLLDFQVEMLKQHGAGVDGEKPGCECP